MSDAKTLKFRVAAVQATPVFLDRAATVEKACEPIDTAAREGARLIVFPETFIPTYPEWVWGVPPSQHGLLSELYAQLLEQSVTPPQRRHRSSCVVRPSVPTRT